MVEDIKIASVQVSPPHIEDRGVVSSRQIAFYEVAVEVENQSSRAYHVVADLRRLRFDPDSKTIYLGLVEEGPLMPPGIASSITVVAPHLVEVPPGRKVSLKVRFPAVQTHISVRSSGLGLAAELVDMTQARRVNVRLGYAEEAFKRHGDESSEDMLRRHASWAKTTERSQAVMLIPPHLPQESSQLPREPSKP
jgi:hypothetical protein